MNMIIHEAVGPYFKVVLLRLFFEKFKIDKLIFIREKYFLFSVTTLNNVMRDIRNNNSGNSGHNVCVFLRGDIDKKLLGKQPMFDNYRNFNSNNLFWQEIL